MSQEGGFITRKVSKFSRFGSAAGASGVSRTADEHYLIVTHWSSFEEHERSHADKIFTSKFEAMAKMCSETKQFGYDILWQGMREGG